MFYIDYKINKKYLNQYNLKTTGSSCSLQFDPLCFA